MATKNPPSLANTICGEKKKISTFDKSQGTWPPPLVASIANIVFSSICEYHSLVWYKRT